MKLCFTPYFDQFFQLFLLIYYQPFPIFNRSFLDTDKLLWTLKFYSLLKSLIEVFDLLVFLNSVRDENFSFIFSWKYDFKSSLSFEIYLSFFHYTIVAITPLQYLHTPIVTHRHLPTRLIAFLTFLYEGKISGFNNY